MNRCAAWSGSIAVAVVLSCSVMSGCMQTKSSTRGVSENPAIMVVGVPEDAVLVVDGLVAGPAQDYSDDRSLAVLPGRHIVEIRVGDRTLAKREVFVDSQGIRTLDFTGVSP